MIRKRPKGKPDPEIYRLRKELRGFILQKKSYHK